MKALWSILSFLAVVHLLVIIMLVGWLVTSGRLNLDRGRQIRAFLATTVAESETAVDEQARVTLLEQEQAEALARRLNPQSSSAETIQLVNTVNARKQQSMREIEEKTQALRVSLDQRAFQLADREADLDARDQAWREANEAELRRSRDEQFQKTVKLYESVPPKQARNMLLVLAEQGEMESAVAYINAMKLRSAAKIIRELKTASEIELATKLLEELRTFGLPSEVIEDSSDADRLASADTRDQ